MLKMRYAAWRDAVRELDERAGIEAHEPNAVGKALRLLLRHQRHCHEAVDLGRPPALAGPFDDCQRFRRHHQSVIMIARTLERLHEEAQAVRPLQHRSGRLLLDKPFADRGDRRGDCTFNGQYRTA